ncbi:MAG: serine/threonine protein kinase [Proteobacteria bacterium]|uniref:serine/threonine protein kinase n=1 Tax=Aquabacterium sp. TaxID=1872578 RepID=UPI0035C72F65|nr:serine/threonine protein kinase [Pseudomonadota bacterium]
MRSAPPALPDQPYHDLTPELTLDALEAFGQRVDGRLLALNSYENRVFQVGLDDGGFVVAKFYRPGRWSDAQILEEHAFAQELADAEVPAVPPLALRVDAASPHARDPQTRACGQPSTLGHFRGHRLSVSPRRGGRSPELEDPEVLRWLGRFLARLHAVGARRPFAHRLRLDVDTTGRQARQWLMDADAIPLDQRSAWLSVSAQALDLAQAAFERLNGVRWRRTHGDCHPGNVLWTPEGPHFVDLDDACMAPAVQDLWMLVSGDPQEQRSQLHALLDGYESVADFDWQELALIEPLRTLRLIHHSAWLARRWSDPAFPAAFPWFDSGSYWGQQTGLLRQQIDLMSD